MQLHPSPQIQTKSVETNSLATDIIKAIIAEASAVILGKEQQIRLSLACILAGGHLLIEDLPGMGKTTLAHTLAQVLGLSFKRTQFTSDLLPADILGVSVFDRNTSSFQFHPGPIFTNVLLADEINRATPKTQSALLEAMEEGQVTLENDTYQLPAPFFVIATQNPKHHIGTFPLPESQLDRFLMRIQLGYPDRESERALLKNQGGRALASKIKPCVDAVTLLQLQQQVNAIHLSEPVLDYLQALIAYTRTHFSVGAYAGGLSPRAGLALKQCAQAWALMQGRDFVIPEDIQAVLPSIVEHRLQTTNEQNTALIGAQILNNVQIP